jgi:hypothetical protein
MVWAYRIVCGIAFLAIMFAYSEALLSFERNFLRGYGIGTFVTVMLLYFGSLIEERSKGPEKRSSRRSRLAEPEERRRF